MEPITASILAGSAISAIGSFFGSDRDEVQYQPNPKWLQMQEAVAKGIRKGIEAGGYTFSEETANQLKRQASLDIAASYRGAEEDIKASLAPYGNVGAMGRGLVGLSAARAGQTAEARRGIDIARETTRLESQQNLLGLGAQMRDPNLPQLQADLSNQQNVLPTSARLGLAGSEGVATGLNVYQYGQSLDALRNLRGQSTGLGNTVLNPGSTGATYNTRPRLGLSQYTYRRQ